MTGKDKIPKPPAKNPANKPTPDFLIEDVEDDGDFATPKRDFNEDEIKDEEDRRP